MASSSPNLHTYPFYYTLNVNSGAKKIQQAIYAAPPSIVILFPLTHSLSLLARKQTMRAMSTGYPFRVNGDACAAIYPGSAASHALIATQATHLLPLFCSILLTIRYVML